jgi:hypothetical protein
VDGVPRVLVRGIVEMSFHREGDEHGRIPPPLEHFQEIPRHQASRRVGGSPVTVSNPDIDRKIGFVTFSSQTIRAFKLPLEDRCDDFDQ